MFLIQGRRRDFAKWGLHKFKAAQVVISELKQRRGFLKLGEHLVVVGLRETLA